MSFNFLRIISVVRQRSGRATRVLASDSCTPLLAAASPASLACRTATVPWTPIQRHLHFSMNEAAPEEKDKPDTFLTTMETSKTAFFYIDQIFSGYEQARIVLKIGRLLAEWAMEMRKKRLEQAKKSGVALEEEDSFYTMQLEMPSLPAVAERGWPVYGAENLTIGSEDGNPHNNRAPIIALMGRYSSGKSYILGQLLQVEERDRFLKMVSGSAKSAIRVSSCPETSGIGFKHHEGRWFLDTEGSLAPAKLSRKASKSITDELSFGKSKQILIERVIRRLADAIVIVLDRITEEDQQLVMDLVKASGKTGQAVHVVCNFKDVSRSEELIDLLKESFNATAVLPQQTKLFSPEFYKASFDGHHASVYAFWKDCSQERSVLDAARLMGTRDAVRNTATLHALLKNLPSATGGLKILDDSLRMFATSHPLIRVAREINNILPDVVHLSDADGCVGDESSKYAHLPRGDDGPALRCLLRNKCIAPRVYNRMNVISSEELQIKTEQAADRIDFEIAAPGCEVLFGKDAEPAADAYMKIWIDSQDMSYEVRAKMKTWDATDGELIADKMEIAKKIHLPREYSQFPTLDEIKALDRQDGVLRLFAKRVTSTW